MNDASDARETDGRWRRARVSSALLSQFLRGTAVQPGSTNAPVDLCIIGLYEITPGPNGNFEFVVWSASFDPVPMGEDGRLKEEIPLIMFRYHR